MECVKESSNSVPSFFVSLNELINAHAWKKRWMDGWVGGWIGGWMDGWVGGWVDG